MSYFNRVSDASRLAISLGSPTQVLVAMRGMGDILSAGLVDASLVKGIYSEMLHNINDAAALLMPTRDNFIVRSLRFCAQSTSSLLSVCCKLDVSLL